MSAVFAILAARGLACNRDTQSKSCFEHPAHRRLGSIERLLGVWHTQSFSVTTLREVG